MLTCRLQVLDYVSCRGKRIPPCHLNDDPLPEEVVDQAVPLRRYVHDPGRRVEGMAPARVETDREPEPLAGDVLLHLLVQVDICALG